MKPDYGIDAPGVIRNLAIGGAAALFVAAGARAGWWPPVVTLPLAGVRLVFSLIGTGSAAAAALFAGAGWMYFGSRYGKMTERERLLNRIQWRGDERVLDLGCGRGLLLVGAAMRLTTGSAVGIDLWQAEDLSGNRPGAPLQNAAAEGVRDRVSVETGDMRRLPFADASFDVVVSRVAIHNIYDAPGRAAAIREVARVLKPGGAVVIDDIRHIRQYVSELRSHGCADVRIVGSVLMSALVMAMTFGSLAPNTIVARKDAKTSDS